ncbi:hypothetical protein [Haloferula sp. A504]|uniref:hypothetical protein n=1 Tax=Haloferula sp. A504 TaxID=3373601 RepID=UPI0031C41249|nr:tyrosine-type recombinase/integrase [Verrucomicrobiaceae bacterium E54]
MAKPARFSPHKITRGKWVVNIPPAYSDSGRRERHFYKSRKAAEEAAAKLREEKETFGEQARAISPTLADQAHAAAKLLAPYDVSLLDVVQRFVAAEQEMRSSTKVAEAVDAFAKTKEHLSNKQQQAVRYMSKHLKEDFGGRMLSGITTQELTEHIDSRTDGASAFNGRRRLLVTFWRWAVKQPRHWAKAEVAENIETKKTQTQEIGILTAKEAARLMAAAEAHFPDCVPGFAIALFTGMRQAELSRLTPEDITEEGIRVPAASAKTKRRRFVNMPSPLAAWLEAYPIGKSVLPPNWKRKEMAVRRLAGFRVWSDLVPSMKLKPKLKAKPPTKLPKWPDNALRHTHATVAIATGATIELLTFEFGHSGGPQMLRSHYVGAMPKNEALAILQIGPKGEKLPLVEVA